MALHPTKLQGTQYIVLNEDMNLLKVRFSNSHGTDKYEHVLAQIKGPKSSGK